MSRTDTWMPLYIGDYLADTMHLDHGQHGAYLLLLMNQWRMGVLPNDDASLAAIARVPLAIWRKSVGPVVRAFFDVTPDGLKQKRLASERAHAIGISEKRAKSGRAGAESKWQNDGKPMANAINEPVDIPVDNMANAIDLPDVRHTQLQLQPQADSEGRILDINSELHDGLCAQAVARSVRAVVRSVRADPIFRKTNPDHLKLVPTKRAPSEPMRSVAQQLADFKAKL